MRDAVGADWRVVRRVAVLLLVVVLVGCAQGVAEFSGGGCPQSPAPATNMRPDAAELAEVERQEKLSTEQRMVEDLASLRGFEARRDAWVDAFRRNGCDLTDLPLDSGGGTYQSYGGTLPEVVAASTHALTGTVTGVGVAAYAATEVTVDVDRVLKGTAADEVTVVQGGGPEMDADPRYGRWLVPDAFLDLRPDDRVLLLLNEENGALLVQPFSGTYRFSEGRVQKPAASIDVGGRSQAELAAEVLRLATKPG